MGWKHDERDRLIEIHCQFGPKPDEIMSYISRKLLAKPNLRKQALQEHINQTSPHRKWKNPQKSNFPPQEVEKAG